MNENMKLVSNLAVVSDDSGNETIFLSEDCPLGRDVSDELCEFIFSDQHKGHFVIAHNFRVSNQKVAENDMRETTMIFFVVF